MTRDQKTAIIWVVVAVVIISVMVIGSSHTTSYHGTPTCEQAYAKNKITAGHDAWVKDCDNGLSQLPEP